MNRILRAPGHDYTSRCIYMITLNKNPLIKKFGTLSGDYRIPSGEKNCAVVNLSEIGNAIKKVLVKFKLSGRYFALCETGRMLIISANMSGSLSCHTCLTMNAIAQSICRNNL